MKRWFDWLWRWSFAITLPVAIVFTYWVAGTYQHYKAFAIDYDPSPAEVRLHDVGTDEWNHLLKVARLAASTRSIRDVPPDQALRTVQLFVAETGLDKLRSDLPYSGFEFVPGRLMFDDGLHDVKVRYRGDYLVHWAYEKKSLRIKTRTDELFEGMRTFNLIVPKFPEQLNNYLGYRLADILGIIAPRCELVNVFLNGRNIGLHEFTEQLDEGTLRRWNRMPGDLYSGDLTGRDQYEGTTSRVFELPELWEKLAANNHFDLTSRAPLERLLRLLCDSPSEENEARLSQLFDMPAWGALGAYELLTQTHHFDEHHNWRLFWDPWALKFLPVVWDPTPWAPEMRPREGEPVPLDLVVSRLHVWLCRNGDFLAARHAALRDFYASGKVVRFLAEVDWAMAAAQAALALDPNVRPTDPRVVALGMQSFRAFVDQVVREVALAYREAGGTVRYTAPDDHGAMAFEVTGRQPVEGVELRFQRPVERAAGAALRIRRGAGRPTFDLSGGVVAQGNTLRVPARMFAQLEPRYRYLPNHVLRQHTLLATPGYYELQFDGLPAQNRLLDVLVVRDGREQRAEAVASIEPSDLEWVYRAVAPQPARLPQIWSGDITVDGVREVGDEVVFEPGTTVRLMPDACILFRARVTAIGATDHPIRFLPAAPERGPWGTVAINGAACGGSTFRHCEFRGGSGLKTPVEEYTAMFSVHNAKDVVVTDCSFHDSKITDDMIHVMYSEIVFDRVLLANAFMDALDCDISRVTVRNSRFEVSGNDGMDLMTTRALVHDCVFDRNGDKGISIGEDSALIAVRDTFDGCSKAMEAKDNSIAHAANCEIRGCERALNAYRKNWRYDAGGSLTIYKSVFAKNRSMPTADPRSSIRMIDCQADAGLAASYDDGDHTVRNRATAIDCDGGPGPRHRKPLLFPDDLRQMEAMAGTVWSTARTDVRGGARDQ